jgi:hypothetical protein
MFFLLRVVCVAIFLVLARVLPNGICQIFLTEFDYR